MIDLSLITPAVISQTLIGVTGVLAAWVNQDPNARLRRWASIIGLFGQPFWFYSTFTASQWGMFAVTCGFTISYGRGFYLGWLKPADRPNHG
jgi:hypothetical protein